MTIEQTPSINEDWVTLLKILEKASKWTSSWDCVVKVGLFFVTVVMWDAENVTKQEKQNK